MVKRIIKLQKKHSFLLFGPRQTGKSTFIRNLLETKKAWEVNLLHSDVFMKYLKQPFLFRKEAEYKIQKEKAATIFVDEIQKIPLLLDEIHSLIFTFPQVQFIATGSSARKMKRGAANLLAGRLVQRFLFPFVHQELGSDFDLDNALRFGTLPALYGKDRAIGTEILKTYVSSYLKEEIQAEGIVRNLGGFSMFLDIAAAQNGEYTNFSAIAREAMLPVRTVQGYYQILEDTLVAIRIDAWHKSIRKRLVRHPKYYFFDTGVTNALSRRLDNEPDRSLRGRLFEQWVVLETYRLLNYNQSDLRIFYWRTNAGAEVDMVLEKSGNLIAACEIKSGRIIHSAHTSGLRSLASDYPNVPKFIVCEADEPFYIGNVEVLPWKIFFERLISRKLH